jgi:hypothetical protein
LGGRRRARFVRQFIFSPGGSFLKTNAQLLDEITAAMADVWLAACDRRVIGPSLDGRSFIVIDRQGNVKLFGAATPDECCLFIHRALRWTYCGCLGPSAWLALPWLRAATFPSR